MKKFISALLCFVLLFSCSALAIAEEAPQLKLSTSKAFADDLKEYYSFSLILKNCIYFESLELLITYNPDVLEYSKVYPYALADEHRHSISCTVTEPGQLRVTAYNRDPFIYGSIEKIEPFCLKVVGKGDTNITVELVSWKSADGEIENGKFETIIENTTIKEDFVKYDINGDGIVTAEDARQALRISVGLETATDRQYYVAGLTSGGSFNAEIARIILRYSVGLEP